jgi:hypothetical protein
MHMQHMVVTASLNIRLISVDNEKGSHATARDPPERFSTFVTRSNRNNSPRCRVARLEGNGRRRGRQGVVWNGECGGRRGRGERSIRRASYFVALSPTPLRRSVTNDVPPQPDPTPPLRNQQSAPPPSSPARPEIDPHQPLQLLFERPYRRVA